jgi:hypothetical protein
VSVTQAPVYLGSRASLFAISRSNISTRPQDDALTHQRRGCSSCFRWRAHPGRHKPKASTWIGCSREQQTELRRLTPSILYTPSLRLVLYIPTHSCNGPIISASLSCPMQGEAGRSISVCQSHASWTRYSCVQTPNYRTLRPGRPYEAV